MSKFMDIVNKKDGVASEQLEELTAIVEDCRKQYGNSDVVIEVPEVSTSEGKRKLTYLSDGDKVAIAGRSFTAIANEAIEAHTGTPGMVLDKELISLIACDPVLVNLAASTGSSIL